MKTIVTGGSGFLGTHVIEELLEHNYEPVIVDNRNPQSIRGLSKMDKIEYRMVDVRRFAEVKDAISEADAVIHLAALISVEDSIRDPLATHDVNVNGTLNLLKACVDNNIRIFIFASSAAVYGEPAELPLKESSTLDPISPYGSSKVSAEVYVRAFSACYGIHCIILRFFNLYGPGQNYHYSGVISKFVQQVRKKQPPIIFGDGRQTRDFLHVRDAATAITKSLGFAKNNSFSLFNIAYGVPVTIIELATEILEVAGLDGLTPLHMPPRDGDIRHSSANIEKAREILGFEPKVALPQGLKQLLE